MASLLIPGTGGTTLLKNGVSLGHPAVLNLRLWLFKTAGIDVQETVLDMSMEHRPGQLAPTKTTLWPNATVAPGAILTSAYNQVLHKIDQTFSYDWRGCIEHSATKLLTFLENKPKGQRWRVVTHSQGGLVLIAASKLNAREHPTRPFSDLVSHISFVGCPLYGTINAARALLLGEDLGDAPREEFKRIAATWPALYQMLPDWRAALRKPDGSASSLTFFSPQLWRFSWIEPELVARGQDVRQRLLRDPVVHLQDISYSFLLARNSRTCSHALLHDNGAITFAQRDVEGDSLVPYEITRSRMSDTERQRCHVIGPNENNPEHAMLLTGPFVVTKVAQDLGL